MLTWAVLVGPLREGSVVAQDGRGAREGGEGGEG
jgi:hypothetical protein